MSISLPLDLDSGFSQFLDFLDVFPLREQTSA